MLPYIAPSNPYINTMIPNNNSSTSPSYNENRHTTTFKRHKSNKYPSPTNQFNLSPNPQYLSTLTTFTNIPNTDTNHHLIHPKFTSRISRTNTDAHAQISKLTTHIHIHSTMIPQINIPYPHTAHILKKYLYYPYPMYPYYPDYIIHYLIYLSTIDSPVCQRGKPIDPEIIQTILPLYIP